MNDKFIWKILLFFICFILIKAEYAVNIDPLGYILYCPCMGRFGNQADHFLGSLSFAKGLNRTLVLPPWVEYRYGEPKSDQVPFNNYFQVEPLLEFHRVITMEKFMEQLAPKIWPPEERISFCYTARAGGEGRGCNAKEGNPFGPFWDNFNVDFIESEFYGPLHYNIHEKDMSNKWIKQYPPDKWPVLAFTGAPATFPVQEENRKIHKYLQWKDSLKQRAHDFIKKNLLKGGGFIGIHLRNGIDWVRACDHITQTPNLFAAPQCLGYRNENGFATLDMCMPSQKTIIKQLKRLIRNIKPLVVSIFVASDSDHMISVLNDALRKLNIFIVKLDTPNPHLELAILGLSNHFVGNCISSFSAFVKRERDAKGLPSSFWAFPPSKPSQKTKNSHDEL